MTPPSRRQVLGVSAMALLAGCVDQESQPEDEHGDDDEDPDEQQNDPDEEPPSDEYLYLSAWIIEDVPASIDPIPSDDDRVDGVGLFTEVFEKLSDEDHERGTVRSAEFGEFEAVSTGEISVMSEDGKATQEAYEDLPEQSSEELPTTPYLEHEGEVISVRLTVLREE
ncbi:hypothetical protein [Natranaeroarchaeum sulfidigenes]|uniref:Uncharacterized protein n=1 Tax=Natranaeroarchaeum sulfidigenes TaxID=2784880 RepID=A0A897MN33_9EURY|nr:hypothetical protein [Natranaeroarchaeum sulfidigenes]QSG02004.1 Uncharacterized protein AArcS_0780 [Natranaeroarchaeum sulfidigenes]